MSETVRRKFADAGLTHSTAHHLAAVEELIKANGYARVSDIARQLEITRGSVSVTMHWLKNAGYVRQDGNRFFHLTDRGCRVAASISKRHRIVEEFLREVLQLPPENAHRESCRIEYLLEGPTTRRLAVLLKYWNRNDLRSILKTDEETPCTSCERSDAECPCCAFECLEASSEHCPHAAVFPAADR